MKNGYKKFEEKNEKFFLNKDLIFIFPYFSQPKESRFIKTFEIDNNYNNKTKKQGKKGMEIIPDKIISKVENRTSILLKNIPQSLTKESILNMIYIHNYIDYIYIPCNEKNKILVLFF